ncbi:MAG: ATPase, T2SS/T4P/T4SS family [Ilumatobacteraceae bacterium]|nr:ATPase, T2SS/T4P/T4SS family [Ilumatobacteraceae bacterium]
MTLYEAGASVNGNAPAYESVRSAVLDEIARSKVDGRDRSAVAGVARAHVDDYQRNAEAGVGRRFARPDVIVDRLVRSVCGAGPFEKFFPPSELAVEVLFKGGVISYVTPAGTLGVDTEPTTEDELVAVCQRLFAEAGAAFDLEHPVVVRQVWGNQVRASVSIPPVSDCLDGTFRIYRPHRTDLVDLVELDSMTSAAANVLAALTLAPTGILVTGGPGSGKSTILSALLRAVPATTITRIVQAVRELDAPHLPGGRWSPEAVDCTIRFLVQKALQFAPQLLVVGETLGEEAFELLKAANAGCGFMTTLHANSAQLGMQSLVTAALMAGDNVPEAVVRKSFARLIDLVVHCEAEPLHRVPDGGRRRRQVMEICAVPAQIHHDEFVLEPLFVREDFGRPLEFVGHHLPGDLERRLDRVLPDGLAIRDLAEGSAVIL